MHESDFSTMAHYSARYAKMVNTTMLRVGLMLLAFLFVAPSALAGFEQDSKPDNYSVYLQRLLQETSTAGELVDRKHFDYEAVLRDVGSDPQNLFKWVKSNTQPLPYTGVLKGAWGVLMERKGNSLDRSLLLAELLERAGHQADFANATLNDEAFSIAKTLVVESLAAPPQFDTTGDISREKAKVAAHQTRISELTDMIPDAVLEDLRDKEKLASLEITQLVDEANKQTEALIRTLPLNDRPASPAFLDALESLKDHWWVMAKAGDETFVFDFFFDQQSRPLKLLGNGQKVIAHGELPESLHHSVTFRVIAEKINAQGEETSGVALTHTLRTAESRMQPVVLSYIPMRNRIDHDELANLTVAELDKDLAIQNEWLPVLQLGGDTISQASIRADGSLNVNAKIPAQHGGGTLSNFVNEKLLDTQKMPRPQDNQLVEVRLEIELIGGGRTVRQTRTLFDFRDLIAGALSDRVKQQQENAAAEAVSAVDKWQAQLAEQQQACSEQSGVALEALRVLEKDAQLVTFEDMDLFSRLMGSDKCLALQMALAHPVKVPSEKPSYRITTDLSDSSQLPVALRVSRAAKFMLAQQFLILPFDIQDSYVYEEVLDIASRHLELIISINDAPVMPSKQAMLEKFSASRPSMMNLLSFALLRQQPSKRAGYAITHTNLVSRYVTMSLENSNAELISGIDIIANGVLPLSIDAEGGRWTAIQQGVFDTLLENYLVAGEQESANTASQFQIDLEQNHATDWVSTEIHESTHVLPNVGNEADRAKVNRVVYSPERVVENSYLASFWLVDLETGQTLGYTGEGRGSSYIVFIIDNAITLRNANNLFILYDVISVMKCLAERSLKKCSLIGCAMELVSFAAGKTITLLAGRGVFRVPGIPVNVTGDLRKVWQELIEQQLKKAKLLEGLNLVVNALGEGLEELVGSQCK